MIPFSYVCPSLKWNAPIQICRYLAWRLGILYGLS